MGAKLKQEILFALYCIKKNLQNSAELRGSFLITIIGMMINNISFLIIWYYFSKAVGVLNGWQAIDIFCLLGILTAGFGLVISFLGGLRELPNYIFRGDLDRFLLSPKSSLLRILTSKLYVASIGDLIFGILSLAVYIYLANLSAIQIILLPLLVILSALVFLGFCIVIFSIPLFFNDGRFISDSFFETLLTASLLPGGAFQGLLRTFFIYLIPALCLGVLPTEILRDLDFFKFLILFSLTCFWMIFSVYFFRYASKFYQGTSYIGQ